jgi:hypothetical protein
MTADRHPEETDVTTPPDDAFPVQGPTCGHIDPWWRGVTGIDPQLPVRDWTWAAIIASTALAARYLSLETRGNRMLNHRPAVYSVAASWREWLAASNSQPDYFHRLTTLRLVLEHQGDLDPQDALDVAAALHKAVTR